MHARNMTTHSQHSHLNPHTFCEIRFDFIVSHYLGCTALTYIKYPCILYYVYCIADTHSTATWYIFRSAGWHPRIVSPDSPTLLPLRLNLKKSVDPSYLTLQHANFACPISPPFHLIPVVFCLVPFLRKCKLDLYMGTVKKQLLRKLMVAHELIVATGSQRLLPQHTLGSVAE